MRNSVRLMSSIIVVIILCIPLSSASLLSRPIMDSSLDVRLVGSWSFDFPEDVGMDDSGQENQAELIDVVKTTGISGNGILLGESGYAAIDDDHSLNFHDTNEFSLSIWVRTFGSGGSDCLISKGVTTFFHDGYGLWVNEGYAHLRFGDGVYEYSLDGSVWLGDGQWHHIAGVWNGGILSLYTDGVLDASAAFNGTTIYDSFKSLEIGSQLGLFRFDGEMDEMRIYDRALIPEEISMLYADPGDLELVFLCGSVEDLSSTGNLVLFTSSRLVKVSFSPFELRQYENDDIMRVDFEPLGMINTDFVFGFFKMK